jgi:hypothetical protein
MKFNSKTFSLLVSTALILSSCHKETNPRTHLLGVFTVDRIIKIHQAVGIYDSTALHDSLDFVDPPASRTYQWKISPDDDAVTFSDHYKNGRAAIIFGHSGDYRISADIYDSLGLKLTGHTNTMAITVVNDTLYPAQSIQPNDELTIRTTAVGELGSISTELQLIMTSLKSYDYYPPYTRFVYTDNSTTGNYSFVFSDSIQLSSYPFAFGYGTKSPVQGVLDMPGLTIGIPANLSITWLGKTYTGTVTLYNGRVYSYNWDNAGPIKIIN